MNDSKKETAPGEMRLDVLIKDMEPVLYDEIYVFATVEKKFNSFAVHPLMTFMEEEGLTLILTRDSAIEHKLDYDFACRMITLNVHSSLDAVGFLTRITQRLAGLQMGVNPVSGFYHDHLFVPDDRAQDALAELKLMSSES